MSLGHGGISTGISYNLSYALWDAAINAGATLDELYKMDQGAYPKEFLAKIIAWYRGKVSIHNHTEVEKAKAVKSKK